MIGYIPRVAVPNGFTMIYFPQLFAVAGVMLLGCISPGPELMAITSHALAKRRPGLFAAFGIATSHALWAKLAMDR